MMDFYYHPILGLQWTGGLSPVSISIMAIPPIDKEKLLRMMKEINTTGILIIDPSDYEKRPRIEMIPMIFTNAKI